MKVARVDRLCETIPSSVGFGIVLLRLWPKVLVLEAEHLREWRNIREHGVKGLNARMLNKKTVSKKHHVPNGVVWRSGGIVLHELMKGGLFCPVRRVLFRTPKRFGQRRLTVL